MRHEDHIQLAQQDSLRLLHDNTTLALGKGTPQYYKILQACLLCHPREMQIISAIIRKDPSLRSDPNFIYMITKLNPCNLFFFTDPGMDQTLFEILLRKLLSDFPRFVNHYVKNVSDFTDVYFMLYAACIEDWTCEFSGTLDATYYRTILENARSVFDRIRQFVALNTETIIDCFTQHRDQGLSFSRKPVDTECLRALLKQIQIDLKHTTPNMRIGRSCLDAIHDVISQIVGRSDYIETLARTIHEGLVIRKSQPQSLLTSHSQQRSVPEPESHRLVIQTTPCKFILVKTQLVILPKSKTATGEKIPTASKGTVKSFGNYKYYDRGFLLTEGSLSPISIVSSSNSKNPVEILEPELRKQYGLENVCPIAQFGFLVPTKPYTLDMYSHDQDLYLQHRSLLEDPVLCRHLAFDLGKAVADLHFRNRIHGDLKPGNIYLDLANRSVELFDLPSVSQDNRYTLYRSSESGATPITFTPSLSCFYYTSRLCATPSHRDRMPFPALRDARIMAMMEKILNFDGLPAAAHQISDVWAYLNILHMYKLSSEAQNMQNTIVSSFCAYVYTCSRSTLPSAKDVALFISTEFSMNNVIQRLFGVHLNNDITPKLISAIKLEELPSGREDDRAAASPATDPFSISQTTSTLFSRDPDDLSRTRHDAEIATNLQQEEDRKFSM